MHNTLIDNTERFKLVDIVKVLISDEKCTKLKIASGYWDLPGTKLILDELKTFFERGGELQLLIGQEPMLRSYQQNQEANTNKFPDFYIKRDIEQLTDDYKPVAKMLLAYTNENDEDHSPIRIHVYGQGDNVKFLHAKCYIFLGAGYANGIIGSSNFTEKGLMDNAELNYLETENSVVSAPLTEYSDSKSHNVWFDEMWENSEPWTGKFIREILKPSPLVKALEADTKATQECPIATSPLTPYELYIKYLQLQFGDLIDADSTAIIKSYLPKNYDAYDYQLDAVKQGFSIMKRHGGFLLGDVVGLGKTVVGVLLIRHFLEQAATLNRPAKVLIVTPPPIKKGWISTIKDFDKESTNLIEPCVTFVTTGSIGNVVDNLTDEEFEIENGDEIDLTVGNYGLILIDESHNFRNSETQKYKALNDLIGFCNPTPYVCLLSATPQNNSPKDIYNQIRFFQREPNHSSLPDIPKAKLDTFFNEQVKLFNEARNMDQENPIQQEKARKIIKKVSKEIREKVLNELMVRRTRTDIKCHYQTDSEALKFPTVKGPKKLTYEMDEELQKLFYDTVMAICPKDEDEKFDPEKHIGFYRYAAICKFTKAENTKLYEKRNLTVAGITKRLEKIMRILLVKRLESSITAFTSSLSNLLEYTKIMIEMINHDCVYVCPDIDVNKVYADSKSKFDVFKQKMDVQIAKKKGNNRCFKSEDFDSKYISQLEGDKYLIEDLLNRWRQNTYDPKFECFKEALIPELFNSEINNPSGFDSPRLVIFTEAVDTQKALTRYITAKGKRVLEISGKNRDENQEKISANFDANISDDKKRNDYDVIVTTEVLAEGVNLHRANVILNYDTPWNATRLMQRIGRVNRIGSKEEFVHVFNFFPSLEGNREIKLVEKAYAKLQSFHDMFGEDSKVFSEREELSEHELQAITDGEESPFGIYINELKDYQQSHADRYEEIKNAEPLNIGGCFADSSNNSSLFVFTDNSQGYVSVCVPENHPETETHVVSPLETMRYLKCDESQQFSDYLISPEDNRIKLAKLKYHEHVTHYTINSDSKRLSNKALEVLAKLRRNPLVSKESKKLLKIVESAIRHLDLFTIKMMLKYDTNQPTLFGPDFDINAMISASFENLSARAKEKRGESHVALYEQK